MVKQENEGKESTCLLSSANPSDGTGQHLSVRSGAKICPTHPRFVFSFI